MLDNPDRDNNSLEKRAAGLIPQISSMLSSSPSEALLADVEALILKYSIKPKDPAVRLESLDHFPPVESIAYKPKQYSWFGKFPVPHGSTDWYGVKSPIFSGPDSRMKQLAGIPCNNFAELPGEPTSLQRTAIGVIAPGIKSISHFTQMREDTIGSLITGSPGAGHMHRDCYILESIDYGQNSSETNQLIENGYAWLDPIRKQRLIVPSEYLGKIDVGVISRIEEVFDIVSYRLPMDNSTTKVDSELRTVLNNGERTIRTNPGIMTDKHFWLQHTILLSKALLSLKESENVWPPTNRPVIVYAQLGSNPNEQYHRSVDIIEAVSILRNSPIRSWATNQVITEAMHDHIPSIVIIDPRTCGVRDLERINNAQIIDMSNIMPNLSPDILQSVDHSLKTYIRGIQTLKETRSSIPK